MHICTIENTPLLKAELFSALYRLDPIYWNGRSSFIKVQLILEGKGAEWMLRWSKQLRKNKRGVKSIKSSIKKFRRTFTTLITKEVENSMNLLYGDLWVKYAFDYINDNLNDGYRIPKLLLKFPAIYEYKRVRDFKLKHVRKVKKGPQK